MSSDRRRFLGWLGLRSAAGAAAFASVPTVAHGLSMGGAALVPAHDPSRDDPHPLPIAETYDMSWTTRVNGKFRAVFDSPEISDGAALVRAIAWCDMYKEVYGTERAEMSPVLVIRHSAIDLITTDAYWERFQLGKEHKLRNAAGKKWTLVNPISAASRPNDERARKYTLESFLASGGVVLACGWAFRFVAGRVQKADKLEVAAARAKALESVIPGVIIQPNGIFACLRAQEAGCHYVLAS